MKIGIIGAGSWGLALAQVLADNGHDVVCKTRYAQEAEEINHYHRQERYFPGLALSEKIRACDTYEDVADGDIVLLAVPVTACETVAREVLPYLKKHVIIINVAKGFHPESKQRLSFCLEKIFTNKAKAIVSLLGPSHAEEVIRRLLTSVNAVSEDDAAAKTVQELFSNDYFRVYRHHDVIGAEIAAATKNIMAIASGILTGLQQGDNARAALMTRGLAEMTRFGVSCGAQKSTFLGLNGVGDLIVTCSSAHSRNFQAGLQIGKANSAEAFLQHNTMTTEGILTTKTVHFLAEEKGISMPITDAVYKVLYAHGKPSQIVGELMIRPLKKENI